MATVLPETNGNAVSVAEIRRSLGITRKALSRLTGYSERAIAGWESGKPLSGPGLQRMLEVQRLLEGLAGVMRREFIPRWLETPNQAFDQLKPLEVIERGQIDRIWRMIFYLESGIAS